MAKIKIDVTASAVPAFGDFTYSPSTVHLQHNDPNPVEFEPSGSLKRASAIVVRVYFPGISPLNDEISFSIAKKGAKATGTTGSTLNGQIGTFHYFTAIYVDGKLYLDADCPTIIVN